MYITKVDYKHNNLTLEIGRDLKIIHYQSQQCKQVSDTVYSKCFEFAQILQVYKIAIKYSSVKILHCTGYRIVLVIKI